MGTAAKLIGCSDAGGMGLADVRAMWLGGRQRLDCQLIAMCVCVGGGEDGNLPILLSNHFKITTSTAYSHLQQTNRQPSLEHLGRGIYE